MISIARKRWVAILLPLAGLGVAAFLAWRWRELPAAALVARLAPAESLVVSLDVGALRRSGVLDLVAGAKAVEEAEYRNFVAETGFDYRTDLDHAWLGFRQGHLWALLRGRFDWRRLRSYAAQHGGGCGGDFCRLPGSSPEKRISYTRLGRGVLAMAVAPDPEAARLLLRADVPAPARPLPREPVWAWAPDTVLHHPGRLPTGMAIFASALAGARHLELTAGPEGGRLIVRLKVEFDAVDEAALAVSGLEGATSMLTRLIAREGQRPNPRDLSGVLAAGRFRRDERTVYGEWPVERVFLEALAAGGSR